MSRSWPVLHKVRWSSSYAATSDEARRWHVQAPRKKVSL
jgi:hypothetical protein